MVVENDPRPMRKEQTNIATINKVMIYLSVAIAFVWLCFFGWVASTNAAVLNECDLTANSWDTAATHRSQRGLSGLSGTAKSVSVNIKSNIDCTTPSSSSNYMRLRDSGNLDYVDCVLVEDQFFESGVSTLAYYNCSDHDISTTNWVIDSGSGGSVACDEGTATLQWGINSSGGCSGYAGTSDTGTDKVYHIYDELYSLDPRDDPVTTIVYPEDDDEYESLLNARYRVYTDVCYSEYGSEDPTFDFVVEYWDGDSWESWTTWSEDYSDGNGLLINNGSCLAYGLGDIYQDPLIPDITQDNLYRIKARATFTETGSYTTENEFTLDTIPYGGGSGGSWGDDGSSGGWDSWDTFLDSLPTHDSIYGSCDFFSLAASQGDGLDCLWSWIQYAIFPPEDFLFNFIEAPFATLADRWPFAYITSIISEIEDGVSGSGTCPLPSLFGDESGLGQDVDELDMCDWFDPIDDYFTANQTAEDTFEVVVWLIFAGAVFATAQRFLLS